MTPQVKLRLATAPECLIIDAGTFSEWGSLLTQAQYLARELFLRAQAWSQESLQTWVLVDAADQPICSCETYQMRSNRGAVYGIASVFTPPRLRGRGWSSTLLTLLIEALKQPGASPAQAVLLFSEVGAGIYQRLGFVARPSFVRTFQPTPSERPGPQPLQTQALFLEGLPARLAGPLDSCPTFKVQPDASQWEWHFARARFYTEALGRPHTALTGAKLGDSQIVWFSDWRAESLKVLQLTAPLDSAEPAVVTSALILAAQCEAYQLGLKRVEIWEEELAAPKVWDELAQPSIRTQREECLAMILPLHPGLLAQDWRIISRSSWI